LDELRYYVPDDPKKGNSFRSITSRNSVHNLYFWTQSKNKMSARFFWFLKRSQILILDRVTILWSCEWVPFFLGHPVLHILGHPIRGLFWLTQIQPSYQYCNAYRTTDVLQLWQALDRPPPNKCISDSLPARQKIVAPP